VSQKAVLEVVPPKGLRGPRRTVGKVSPRGKEGLEREALKEKKGLAEKNATSSDPVWCEIASSMALKVEKGMFYNLGKGAPCSQENCHSSESPSSDEEKPLKKRL